MDDLLRVFLVETFEGLSESDADVDRLCEEPDDTEALGNIMRLVSSIRETSSFLGLPGLHATAVAAVDMLSNLKREVSSGATDAGAPVRRAIADIKSAIVQLEQSVAGTDPIYEAHRRAERLSAKPEPARIGDAASSVPKSPSKKKQTLTELFANDDAKAARSLPQAAAPATTPIVTAPPPVENMESAPIASPSMASPSDVSSTTPPTPSVIAAPDGDGTVRISAETLDNLLSTVRQLMASQSEMMQLLKQKEDAVRQPTAPPLANPIEPAPTPANPELGVAAMASIPAAGRAKAEPMVENIISLPTRRTEPEETKPTGIRPAPAPVPQSVKLMVFQTSNGATKAIRASLVDNVRDVDIRSLDGARGLWVLRTEARLIPLVPVDGGVRQLTDGLVPAILCCIDGAWMGLLVRSVLGMVDANLVMASTGGRHNRIATTVINDMPVDVIDPARCLNDAIDGSAPRSRAPEQPKSPGPSQKSTVVHAFDLFERKPTR